MNSLPQFLNSTFRIKIKEVNPIYQTVADIGEFDLIERIKKILPAVDRPELIIGIGDDAAAIQIDDHRVLLITGDIQVENQHFRLNHISPYHLGKRAMAVNLSDIAAMGGQPTFALVSLGFPKSLPLSSFDELTRGMADQLAEFEAHIIGGNLSHTRDDLIIDITLLGEIAPHHILTRSGATPGDRIFVTGKLGEAGAGFHILEKFGKKYPNEFEAMVQKHWQPVPRIEVGKLMAQSGFATAMIDISDGLASDLFHICTRSSVGAEIYQNRIPLPERIQKVAALAGKSALTLALHSGEDYELLITTKPETPQAILQAISKKTGVALTEIGRIVTKESGYHLINLQNQRVPLPAIGWNHFSNPKNIPINPHEK